MANVRESTKIYGNPLNDFTWIIHRSIIVEPIEMATSPEQPLLQPTQLNVASFDSFDCQSMDFEFGTCQYMPLLTYHTYITYFR